MQSVINHSKLNLSNFENNYMQYQNEFLFNQNHSNIFSCLKSVTQELTSLIKLVEANLTEKFSSEIKDISDKILPLYNIINSSSTEIINKVQHGFISNGGQPNVQQSEEELVDPQQQAQGRFETPEFPAEWRTNDALWPIHPDTPSYKHSDEWKVAYGGRATTRQKNRQSLYSEILLHNKFDVLTLPESHSNNQPSCIKEKEGNIFNGPSNVSLAHCVGADLRMEAGIAVDFKHRYGNLSYLKSQNKSPGDVITLPIDEDKFIFYLITKQLSSDKPTISTIEKCLESLKNICINLGLHEIAMPRICSGCDRMPWHIIKALIERQFENSIINVYILSPPPKKMSDYNTSNSNVVNFPPLQNRNVSRRNGGERPAAHGRRQRGGRDEHRGRPAKPASQPRAHEGKPTSQAPLTVETSTSGSASGVAVSLVTNPPSNKINDTLSQNEYVTSFTPKSAKLVVLPSVAQIKNNCNYTTPPAKSVQTDISNVIKSALKHLNTPSFILNNSIKDRPTYKTFYGEVTDLIEAFHPDDCERDDPNESNNSEDAFSDIELIEPTQSNNIEDNSITLKSDTSGDPLNPFFSNIKMREEMI
jgi:hypothetical protein